MTDTKEREVKSCLSDCDTAGFRIANSERLSGEELSKAISDYRFKRMSELWDTARSGERDAVIEECAKIAERGGCVSGCYALCDDTYQHNGTHAGQCPKGIASALRQLKSPQQGQKEV